MDLEETLSALRGFVGVQVSVSTVRISPDRPPMPPRWGSELFGVLSLGQEALDPDWGDLTPDLCEAFGLETHEGGTIIVMRAVDTGDEIGVYDVIPRSFQNSEWVEIGELRSLVINLGHSTVTVSPYEP